MRRDDQVAAPGNNVPLPQVVTTRREMQHRMRRNQPAINQPLQDTVPGSDSAGGSAQESIDIRPPIIQ